MARSRQPQGYPRAYFELIEKVSNTGQPFTFPRKDRKAAELMRFQLYSFIKACRASSNPKDELIGKQAYGLVFSVQGNNLVISLRDNTNEAQEIEAALQAYDKETSPPAGTLPVTANTVAQPTHSHKVPTDSHEDMINQFMKKEK